MRVCKREREFRRLQIHAQSSFDIRNVDKRQINESKGQKMQEC